MPDVTSFWPRIWPWLADSLGVAALLGGVALCVYALVAFVGEESTLLLYVFTIAGLCFVKGGQHLLMRDVMHEDPDT